MQESVRLAPSPPRLPLLLCLLVLLLTTCRRSAPCFWFPPAAAVGMFTAEEVQEVVDIGYLNGLFVLARSIGFIGELLTLGGWGGRVGRVWGVICGQ